MERSTGMDRILFGDSGADYEVTFLAADPFVRIRFEGII